MRRLFHLPAALVLLSALSAPALRAQPGDGHPNTDRPPRVIFYESPDFRGQSLEVEAGADLANLARVDFDDGRGANDAFSSVIVEPGAEAVLFTDSRFRGGSIRLARSVANLDQLPRGADSSWDDVVSSLRVDAAPANTRPDRGPRPEPRVVVYRKSNYEGESRELAPGESLENLSRATYDGGRKLNDSISSIRIIGPVRLIGHADPAFRGPLLEVTADLPNLDALALDPEGRATWNDTLSSLRVEWAGRPGDGPRPGRPPRGREPDPDQLIRHEYNALLGRAPTDTELAAHSRRIRDDGWTPDMLRADIRRTREYREREADPIIDRAYRDILGRAPDPEGRTSSRAFLIDRGGTERQLRDALLQGPEYQEKRRADATALISAAYRDLLGREPDPEGLEAFLRLVLDKGWNDARLRRALRESDEYRQRAPH